MNGTISPSAAKQSGIVEAIFFDFARLIPEVDLSSDKHYLLKRYAREGESFLLSTLPKLGRAIEQSLITEEPFELPLGWSLKKGTRLPVFLHSLFKRVWREDGVLLYGYNNKPVTPITNVIFALRQITMFWSKVVTPIKKNTEEEAFQAFSERVTLRWDISELADDQKESFVEAKALLHRLFSGDESEVLELRRFQNLPWGKHGPGAVSDRSEGCEKWRFDYWPGMNRELFLIHSNQEIAVFRHLSRQPCGRVTLVPKDHRGPRTICIEPKENQFAQQGLMAILYRLCHHSSLTRRSIRFDDVEPSRRLCYRSDCATIDLKDASDRITIDLARALLPKWIFRLVTRYRTREVTFNGHRLKTTCLASMGNATCFPLETLIFWALAQGYVNQARRGHSQRTRRYLPKGPIRVFGDDIICPLMYATGIADLLEACGLLVNHSKTCIFSLVRESCGEWVYDGEAIEIIRPRSLSVKDDNTWIQWNDYATLAGKLNLTATKNSMSDSVIGWYRPIERWNRHLQRAEVRVPQTVISGKTTLDGVVGLYAHYTGNDMTPVLRGARKLVKKRWVARCAFSWCVA